VALSEARIAAADARKLIAQNVDPLNGCSPFSVSAGLR
jgi:hypothetical protein